MESINGYDSDGDEGEQKSLSTKVRNFILLVI